MSLIWVKRILPFVVILAIWLGYSKISDQSKQTELLQVKKYALTAAQIWHSGAALRATPDQFPAIRDSLLAENDIDSLNFQQYLQQNQEFPEQHLEFAHWLNFYSDSLSKDYEAKAISEDSTETTDLQDSQDFDE